MTALPVSDNIEPSSCSIEMPQHHQTNNCKMVIDACAQDYKTLDGKNGFMMEEALECTAVISPSATTLVTSATTSDESDNKTTLLDVSVPQSHLLSLNDGPTNHQVQVNYFAIRSDGTSEHELKIHRRSKSTGNLPNISLSKNMDDYRQKGTYMSEIPNNISNQVAVSTSSTSNKNTLSDWMDSSKDRYSCDVGNTFQAITTIAFHGPSSDLIAAKGLENDDETSSVGSSSSVAYFDPSDFDSSTWRNVVWNHASTTAVGIVTIVALATTAIAHPLFFLAASALAAVGTITASISHRDAASSSPSSAVIATKENDKNLMNDKNIETSPLTSTTESSWSTWLCFDIPFQSADDDVLNGTFQEATLEHFPESTLATTLDETKSIDRVHTEPPTVIRHKLSKDDQSAWVQRNFPRLCHRVGPTGKGTNDNPTSSSVSLVGLNAIDCFRVFFDDAAPYSFSALQEKRGDLHIEYGLWNTLAKNGKISMFDHKNSMPFPIDIFMQSYQGRLLTFHAKTNAMFGPPFAKTTKIQKFLLVNRRLAILESKTTLSGIPFSDRFYVGERWIFMAEKIHNEHYVTHVHVECEVFFHSGSCPFEQQIKSKSMSTINDVVSSWCMMAVEALKLTEMAKLHRMQRTMDDDPDDETVDDMVSIENVESDKNSNWNCDDSIEVVADASLLSNKFSSINDQRPRATLRGIKHFGRHRHSFDDESVAK